MNFKKWLISESKKPITATIAVFNNNMQILIGVKHDGRKCLPGGYVEDNENVEDTALRELEEETGIIANKAIRIGTKHFGTNNDALFVVKVKDVKLKPASDIKKLMWLSKKDVPHLSMGHNEIVDKAFKYVSTINKI